MSVVLVVFLALLAMDNIPGNPVSKVDDPVLRALGALQVWSVFAPDPPDTVDRVSVRFTYRDGSSSVWHVPRGGALVHGYRDYRWIKLAEHADGSDVAGAGLLLWATRTQAGDKPLAQAELMVDEYEIAAPGTPRGRHGPVTSRKLLTLRTGG